MTLYVTHHNDLTPARRRLVDLWFSGLTSDKEMARAEGCKPAAIRSRMAALMFQAGCAYGARREQAMLSLLDRGLIEITRSAQQVAAMLMLSISCLLGTSIDPGQEIVRLRPTRTQPGRVRTGRRQRDHLDFTDVVLDDLADAITVKGATA